MALSLSKGGNLSLSKEEPGLKKILIGLGWDERQTDGVEFDLDASLFMLKSDGKVGSEKDFIFYHQPDSVCKSVHHTGDNRTGEGDGDDESIQVDLSKVPADVQRLVITVTIHDAERLKQNFGQVVNSFIRVVNDENDKEIVRYDLGEEYSTQTAMIFGEIYRNGAEWKFKAVGDGYAGGLKSMCEQYGVDIRE